ncbi:hypothetical protein BN128_597 [Cronobacter sakazakii 696]|nr:hypothetical protein BN128_597 [Cronobacter sakazakii 696]
MPADALAGGANTGHEFAVVKRFWQVIIRAQFKAEYAIQLALRAQPTRWRLH